MPDPTVLRTIDTRKYHGGSLLSDPEGLVKDLNDMISTMFLESLGDDQSPRLSWVDAATVRVGSPPGSSVIVRLTLQDGLQRTFDSPLTLSLPADLDAGSEAADTWYYVYAVPDPADDSKLIGKLSTAVPGTGPSGFANYRYLGAVRNDSGSDLLRFSQAGAVFKYHSIRTVTSLGAGSIVTEAVPVVEPLVGAVPVTADEVVLAVRLEAQAGGAGTVGLFVDGSQAQPQYDYVEAPNSSGDHRTITVPTPTSPKQIYRQIQETAGQLDSYSLEAKGWVDGYLA
jgi:hypothetical protein